MQLPFQDQFLILFVLLYMWFWSCFGMPTLDDCNNTGVLELSSVPVKVSYKGSMWTQHLDFYYFKGYQRRPSSLFLDVHLQFNLTDRDVKIYQGSNCSAVWEQYNNDYRLFGLLRQFSLLRSKQLNPFDCTVVGIIANEPYTVRLRIWEVNYLRAGFFIGAIILYLLSYSLVRNALFFYSSGCALGLISSLLIVGFVVYRFAPKKWIIGFPLLFGGWSVSFYGIYLLWRNFTNIVLRYQKFVAAYFATVLIVSFAICYRYGPPTDIRSHNLAQWALQLIALIIIYFSCQIDEISISVIVILVLWTCTKHWIIQLTRKILSAFLFLWHLFFPRTRRLLTLGEYERQGIEETRKAMEQLRSYCRSPQADAWKITSSISNPKRFASFVEGDCDHIEEEEIRLHEAESSGYSQYSDDSGEDEHLRNIRNSRRNVADLNNTSYITRRNRMRMDPRYHASWDGSVMDVDDIVGNREVEREQEEEEEEDEQQEEEEEQESGSDNSEILENQWPISPRTSSPNRRRLIQRSFHEGPDNEYNGLLMPVSSHLRRSNFDRLCTFYNLTEQQAAIYNFLKSRGQNRGSDYAGESELSIKQNLPRECIDHVTFDDDLGRLVEVNLIHESFLDGYWLVT